MQKRTQVAQHQAGGAHYTQLDVQPWDVVDTWPLQQQIGYHRGNVLKYIMRFGNKDAPLQELKKAQHYLTKLIDLMERQ